MIYIAALEAEILIQLSRITQIAALQWNKVFIKIPANCFDYANVFSVDLAMELSENTNINKYVIKLIKEKQSLHGIIYTLNLRKQEILKAYINTDLKTGFI